MDHVEYGSQYILGHNLHPPRYARAALAIIADPLIFVKNNITYNIIFLNILTHRYFDIH